MLRFVRILPQERARFFVLFALLFINALVLESNEVIATSGFVTDAGPRSLLWVWAIDMAIIIFTSGAYSLIVDRVRRSRLTVLLFASWGLVYLGLYASFSLGAPRWASYALMTVINDQQWVLFPMLIWALANDMFTTAEAKRLFPVLGTAALLGGIVGGGAAAAIARWLRDGPLGGVRMILFNVGLLWLVAAAMSVVLRRVKVIAHRSAGGEGMVAVLQEGIAFVRDVPSYRYLTIAMILAGVALNSVEYWLIVGASQTFGTAESLQTFYGSFRAIRTGLLLVVQGVVSAWVINRVGFKNVFVFMPLALLTAISLVLAWPGMIAAVVGEYLVQVVLQGIDEPARRAFESLVPDERRGRVSAFLDGYLYPLGSILGCGLIAASSVLPSWGGQVTYLGVSWVCSALAVWSIMRFRANYEVSMLNWRLRRRRRKSFLTGMEFEPVLTPPGDKDRE